MLVQAPLQDSIRKIRMEWVVFSIWKRGIFRRGKKTKGLRGGVPKYAAQANTQVAAATAEKYRFQA
jgi:hypothetical protein